MPALSKQYFLNQLSVADESDAKVALSAVQGAILCGMGLQKKYVEDLEKELGLSVSQILALFAKSIKRCVSFFDGLVEQEFRGEMPSDLTLDGGDKNDKKRSLDDDEAWDPHAQTLHDDLEEAGEEAMEQLREKQKEMIKSMDLSEYFYIINSRPF